MEWINPQGSVSFQQDLLYKSSTLYKIGCFLFSYHIPALYLSLFLIRWYFYLLQYNLSYVCVCMGEENLCIFILFCFVLIYYCFICWFWCGVFFFHPKGVEFGGGTVPIIQIVWPGIPTSRVHYLFSC